jgi:hydrogenase expression/formation protein HypC
MCLGVPGRVARWIDRDPLFARAEVEFEGVRKVCHMACVLDAEEGDYVVVHAGLAISRIDATEVKRMIDELGQFASSEEASNAIDVSSLHAKGGDREVRG